MAEPTSMAWLALSVALQDAGCDLSLLGPGMRPRLRGAISGKHKSDVIDADMWPGLEKCSTCTRCGRSSLRSWRYAGRVSGGAVQ